MQSTREALPIYVIGKAYQFLARMRLFIKNKVLVFNLPPLDCHVNSCS